MAYTMEECFEMYRKGRASGRVFFVGQQRLFDPKYIRIMDSVRKGELGPVVNVRNYWYRNNDWRRKVPRRSWRGTSTGGFTANTPAD